MQFSLRSRMDVAIAKERRGRRKLTDRVERRVARPGADVVAVGGDKGVTLGFGEAKAGQYREFAETYGFDVRAWDGYPLLREVRALTMTTWIMQNIGESAAVAAEFATRVDSLRERDFTRAWHYF